jgi:hypothetical protein
MVARRTPDHEPEQLFEGIAARLLTDPAVSQGTGFGSSPGLRVGTKILPCSSGTNSW